MTLRHAAFYERHVALHMYPAALYEHHVALPLLRRGHAPLIHCHVQLNPTQPKYTGDVHSHLCRYDVMPNCCAGLSPGGEGFGGSVKNSVITDLSKISCEMSLVLS